MDGWLLMTGGTKGVTINQTRSNIKFRSLGVGERRFGFGAAGSLSLQTRGPPLPVA